ALLGAVTALVGAFSGWGVWTLIAAPLATFVSRAAGMMVAARAWYWPSFDFKGARGLADYGGIVMSGQIFWFLQTQSDIVIAGRVLGKEELGLYTVSLFLAQIFVTKVVPPLNEVAFSAYARIQDDRSAIGAGFLKSVRVIMLLAMPFCMGMAATSEPLVQTMLGEDKAVAAPIVALLALAMPFMTLHVLFAPATNACGRPGIATRASILGTLVMPAFYYIGVQYGVLGLAAAWLASYPVLTAISAAWSLPVIGLKANDLIRALSAPVLAGIAMAVSVVLLDRAMPAMPDVARLALLVCAGGAIYGGWLLAFARDRLDEARNLILKR
ncbi:MAG: oligosaccharide flippase family protein, partial [Sphingomonadales bacterium]|nr:oligosaccharide flippase family protein [Sphingomonadales bacterium]